jgi:hypothetical protein
MEISILGMKFNLVTLIIIFVLYWIMVGHVLCSCSTVKPYEAVRMFTKVTESFLERKSLAEAFTNINSMSGDVYSDAKSPAVNTSSWFTPNLSYTKGQDISKDAPVQMILNRPKQPIPLPEGELDFFATTEFKPECCPNAYSNSTGCACMTVPQYNYLISRAGNNVPYSEY